MILVRHAHAGSRKSWPDDDALRPLSELGHAQARSLAARLGGERVSTLWSSPTVRCEQTVAPLARTLGVPVRTSTLLVKGADADDLLDWLLSPVDAPALVCTHGEVFDALHEASSRSGRRQLVPKLGTEKGAVWRIGDPREVAEYLSPEPPQHN